MTVSEINMMISLFRDEEDFIVKDVNDGRHTFGELYEQRTILFCTLCNSFQNLSWKSKKHFDENKYPMYNDCFIAGVNTPKGVVSFHIKLKYWDDFKVKALPNAPNYNGKCDVSWLLSLK